MRLYNHPHLEGSLYMLWCTADLGIALQPNIIMHAPFALFMQYSCVSSFYSYKRVAFIIIHFSQSVIDLVRFKRYNFRFMQDNTFVIFTQYTRICLVIVGYAFNCLSTLHTGPFHADLPKPATSIN